MAHFARTIFIACLTVLFLCTTVIAEEAHPLKPSAKQAALGMEKLQFLKGEWRGEGWMEGPKGRHSFHQSKIVTDHMDHMVLAIEGNSMTSEDIFYSRTLVMVSWDGKSPYRIHAYGAPDAVVDGTASLTGDTFEWRFDLGKMRFRYRIHIDEKGLWDEVGDRSMDEGATWHEFTELRLDKMK